MNLNHIVLCGRIGKDPESKKVSDSFEVVNFSLATTEKWKDKQTGEQREDTTWHNCQASNSVCNVIKSYVHKGDLLYVEGKLKVRAWDNKEGVKQYSTFVQVESVQLFPKAKKEGEQLPSYESNGFKQQEPEQPEEDLLPF